MHDDQPHEHETDVGVIRDPNVQQLQGAECGGGGGQQAEMDPETGDGSPCLWAIDPPLEQRSIPRSVRYHTTYIIAVHQLVPEVTRGPGSLAVLVKRHRQVECACSGPG